MLMFMYAVETHVSLLKWLTSTSIVGVRYKVKVINPLDIIPYNYILTQKGDESLQESLFNSIACDRVCTCDNMCVCVCDKVTPILLILVRPEALCMHPFDMQSVEPNDENILENDEDICVRLVKSLDAFESSRAQKKKKKNTHTHTSTHYR
eukprot:GHVR01095809.1.p1 GENE.GHVR01095809.1~~GHVR01095809.1.p1  ORF type:complete len:151 (-),score=45.59 GHVR01095809.1:163-615(-)